MLRTAGLLGLGIAAVAMAACGSSASPSASATSSTVRSSTTSPSPTSTTSASHSPSTAAAAGTSVAPSRSSQCAFSQLRVGAGSTQAAAGHVGVVLVFTNTARYTCTLAGYPGVAGLNDSGQQVLQATRTPQGYLGGLGGGATSPPTVNLAGGQSASAIVEGTDIPASNSNTCPTYSGLLVTPPNLTQSARISNLISSCSGLQVHPVVTGTTGSQS